jgi:hypothetical protein
MIRPQNGVYASPQGVARQAMPTANRRQFVVALAFGTTSTSLAVLSQCTFYSCVLLSRISTMISTPPDFLLTAQCSMNPFLTWYFCRLWHDKPSPQVEMIMARPIIMVTPFSIEEIGLVLLQRRYLCLAQNESLTMHLHLFGHIEGFYFHLYISWYAWFSNGKKEWHGLALKLNTSLPCYLYITRNAFSTLA